MHAVDPENPHIEFATAAFATPGKAVPIAVAAERAGFDILHVTDSQCLRGDVYTQLMLCGQATSTIKLATGVTNPLTRHPSVTAASIISVQAECGDRAILEIGRGDSAVLHVGRKPAPTTVPGQPRADLFHGRARPDGVHGPTTGRHKGVPYQRSTFCAAGRAR